MTHKVIADFVNRGVFGLIFLGLLGVISAIAGIMGMTLSTKLDVLGTAIGSGNVLGIIFWVIATLILAVVAIYMTKHSKVFKVIGRSEADKVDIPNKVGVFTLIVLGALISISITIFSWFWSTIGGTDVDFTSIVTAFQSGNLTLIGLSILSVIIVGYLVFGIASWTGKLADKLHKSKITDKIPDVGSGNA